MRRALALLLLWPSAALAGGNDFTLNARSNGQGVFFRENADGTFAPEADRFRLFATELGYAIAPRTLTPAATLGHAGFQVGLSWAGTFVSSDEAYWRATEAAQQQGGPSSVLQTVQLDVKKGLPLSFELGARLLWLADSELFAPGLDLRFSPFEGFRNWPDFSVGGSVTHLTGHRDLNLTVAGLNLEVSKGFGLGGIVHFTPYFDWSVLFIAASSRVIDPTPTDETDLGRNIALPAVNAGDNVHQRMTLGVRALFYLLTLGVEAQLEMFRKDEDSRKVFGSVATIATQLGLSF